jgi:hypothetical protein
MTDQVGIFQHAVGSRRDPAHGYCVDDVARALQVDLLHGRVLGWAAVADSAWRGFRFLAEAFDAGSGRFGNFRSVDGTWIGGIGSEDSHGRAVLALGDVAAVAPDGPLVDAASSLLIHALPAAHEFTSPRAEASVVLGCAAMLGPTPGGTPAAMLELLGTRLHGRFRLRATVAWPWPEDVLTYENALLPRALIAAGRRLGSDLMTDTGLDTLDWLIEAQTSSEGHLSPIGNGWWPRDGDRSRFDQQPIEATALILAAKSAHAATRDDRYRVAIERSYAWFLGANDSGLRVADPERGACKDGLTPRGVNANEGAESTLMWLMASEHTRATRDANALPARPTEFLATSIS